MIRRAQWLGTSALAIVLVLFLGLPILALVGRATLGGSLAGEIGQSDLFDALVLSLLSSGASLALTAVFGTPLAYVLARRRFRGAAIVETIVDLPVVLPPAVAGLALLLLLGRRGVLGSLLDQAGIGLGFTFAAVVLAQAFVSAPLFVRSARVGFAAVDRDIEDAARVDGASEPSVFRLITMPLANAALGTGLVLAWARALGEFGATIMFAGNVQGMTQTLPLFVYAEFQNSLDASVAAAAILVLAAFGVLFALRLRGRNASELRGGG
jgi:molybdate transport system permease protein